MVIALVLTLNRMLHSQFHENRVKLRLRGWLPYHLPICIDHAIKKSFTELKRQMDDSLLDAVAHECEERRTNVEENVYPVNELCGGKGLIDRPLSSSNWCFKGTDWVKYDFCGACHHQVRLLQLALWDGWPDCQGPLSLNPRVEAMIRITKVLRFMTKYVFICCRTGQAWCTLAFTRAAHRSNFADGSKEEIVFQDSDAIR